MDDMDAVDGGLDHPSQHYRFAEAPVLVAIARMEGKLDAAIAGMQGEVRSLGLRVTALENNPIGQPERIIDLEMRARQLEARPYIRPGVIFALVSALTALLGAWIAYWNA
jgi:hypothetical protein